MLIRQQRVTLFLLAWNNRAVFAFCDQSNKTALTAEAMTGTDVAEGAIVAFLPIRDIRRRFDATEVPHGVSVETGDSACVIPVSRSGCGKSTLLTMVAGLGTISSGEIAMTARLASAHLFDASNHQQTESG